MTAVEWFAEELRHCLGKNMIEITPRLLNALEKQAKEMEKEQIKDAYFNGRYEADKIVMGHNFYAEQYYKQTFKSE